MPGSPKWSVSFRFTHRNPVHASPLPIPATHSAHLIRLHVITWKILGEQYRSLSSSLCSFLHSYYHLSTSLLYPNIFLSTLHSNTLTLHSSLYISNQNSHPLKTTGKI
jgi:hypothetical protein